MTPIHDCKCKYFPCTIAYKDIEKVGNSNPLCKVSKIWGTEKKNIVSIKAQASNFVGRKKHTEVILRCGDDRD